MTTSPEFQRNIHSYFGQLSLARRGGAKRRGGCSGDGILNNHPVCAIIVASRYLLDRAATLLARRGNSLALPNFDLFTRSMAAHNFSEHPASTIFDDKSARS